MARSSSSRSSYSQAQRDFTSSYPSLDALLRPDFFRPLELLPVSTNDNVRSVVLSMPDRRSWRPDASTAAPAAYQRSDARLKATAWSSPFSQAFVNPSRVGICIRRKVRREVLFALRKHGKGARSPRRRNFWSEVVC